MNLADIIKLSNAKTRSITAENVYGEKGRGGMAEVSKTPQPEVVKIGQQWEGPSIAARELGRTWKVRPCIKLPAKTTTTVMDVDGPGMIQHIWITSFESWYRYVIVRMYWDWETTPSVEVPLGDFFCNGWKTNANVLALPINVNPTRGLNCYFPMPFRRHARITVENRSNEVLSQFFYAINYALTKVDKRDAYFHAQFRRTNPVPYKDDYVILDGVKGKGQYVGTYLAWQQNTPGWWGEGEFKAFIDGDREFPTICGTGTEDYFGGAWCFGQTYSAPFLGYPLGVSDGAVGRRHGLYRFHIPDPIHFAKDLRVTMQALGAQFGERMLHALPDDIASVAYWYQAEPHAPFPELPKPEQLEVSDKAGWQSEFIANWKISKLRPKGKGLADACAAALTDPLDWKPIQAGQARGFVDVHPLYEGADGIVYLATQIEAKEAGRWILSVGHDGGVRVFLDGRPVLLETQRVNPAVPGRSQVKIELTQGAHCIVVALDTDHGLGWGIFARFEQWPEDRKVGTTPLFPLDVQ